MQSFAKCADLDKKKVWCILVGAFNHLNLMDSYAWTLWTSQFAVEGVSGLFLFFFWLVFYFYHVL